MTLSLFDSSEAPKIKKFTLSVTHGCNMACRYCYAGKADKPDMSVATMERAIDFAWHLTSDGDPFELGFFGGEPLLKPDLLRHAIQRVRLRNRVAPRQVRYQVTTNGVCLDDALLDWIRTEEISLCISLDGPPAIQNANRPLRNGQPSSAILLRNLELALRKLPRVQVNAVFGPKTLERLPDTVAYLHGLGVRSLHLNPDIQAEWPVDVLGKADAVLGQLTDQYISYFKNDQPMAVNLLDIKIVLYMKGGFSTADRCGMGRTEWAIAPSGNVYPCERLIGRDDDPALQLGNVHGEVRTLACPGALGRAREPRPTVAPQMECRSCPVRDHCMHWCGCTNYHQTGDVELPGQVICALEKASLRAASHALTTLTNEKNQNFINHFMQYLQISPSPPAIQEYQR
ncbi:MAG: radical SAM protein [Magnetococcales bacterium]|nr:radical SAM protein [Magnetococcales bacterium]